MKPKTEVVVMGADLSVLPTPELRTELAKGLTLTADTLRRLGSIWAELERRGEDLSDLRVGLARTLPLIAAGVLSAEAVVAFSGRPALLRALEGVPIQQQVRLAAGDEVKVIDPTNPAAVVSMPLAHLPAASVRLLFDDGEIRSPETQRLAFRPRAKRVEADRPAYRYRPKYDPENGTITVGKMTIKLADLLKELAAASGPDLPPEDAPDDYLTFKVRLARHEMPRFLARCKQIGLPDWEIARKCLRAFGLI